MSSDRLVAMLAELTDSLVPEFEPAQAGRALLARSAELLAVAGSVVLLDGPEGRPRLVAESDTHIRDVKLAELDAGQGPGMEALRSGATVSCADLGKPGVRWPEFAELAVRLGFRAVDAVPLRARDRILGVLCLFGTGPGGLTAAGLRIASVLARLAAIGLVQERRIRERTEHGRALQDDLDRRIVVEQATGVLAERWRTSAQVAAETLGAIARAQGVPLHIAAAAVVASAIR